ncbi:MAG: zinc ABC transporter substrate-binding protein, partial [Pseudomonadota bacterium]
MKVIFLLDAIAKIAFLSRCHCERSEAIQLKKYFKNGLPRFSYENLAMTKFAISLLFFLLISTAASAQEKIKVVASFSIIGDMVKQVAGDKIDLHVLVGANGEVHGYEPNPKDSRLISSSDIIFINGFGLEGWIERLIKSSDYKGKVITLTKNVKPLQNNENGVLSYDPHAWQSVKNAKIYVLNIKDALIAVDAKNAEFFSKNADDYIKKLDALEQFVKAEINKISPEKRKVISTHDAFRYFANDYGVLFIPLLGITPESQPSAMQMAKTIDRARTEKISTIFLENMSDDRLIKQLEKDANLRIGGKLYADSLSDSQGAAKDY